jgi:hypothetical protein
MAMGAEQVQDFLPLDLLLNIALQYEFGQVKPVAERGGGDFLNHLAGQPFDCVTCIFDPLVRGGQ